MIKSLADSIKVGDIVYDIFMQKMVVSSIHRNDHGLTFALVDTGFITHYYSYENIYFEDLYGESDEEKSWINWVKNNKEFINTFDHLSTIKWIYQQGFVEGFIYRKTISFEEMMQK